MTFMQKFLDLLKLDSTRKMEEKKKETFQKKEFIPNLEKSKTPKSQKRNTLDVERYAVMCNAYLEHEEEMEQYKIIIEEQE